MTNHILFAASLLSSLLSSAPAVRAADPVSGNRPELTIRLYNHAEAPAELLRGAGKVGREIFRRAGLKTTWLACGTRPEQPNDPSCSVAPGKSVLRVNVLNREMSERMGAVPEAFGVAFPAKEGFGLVASVFHHRVAEFRRDSDVDGSLILGHILAHEIGHLLLGFKGHTQRGIMSAVWDEAEILRLEQGSFRFFKSQARRMRRQVEARMLADAARGL